MACSFLFAGQANCLSLAISWVEAHWPQMELDVIHISPPKGQMVGEMGIKSSPVPFEANGEPIELQSVYYKPIREILGPGWN